MKKIKGIRKDIKNKKRKEKKKKEKEKEKEKEKLPLRSLLCFKLDSMFIYLTSCVRGLIIPPM